jgi:hypothetical protein
LSAALSALLLAACQGVTPERAELLGAHAGSTGERHWIEVEQRLQFSDTLLAALDNGVPLRLGYRLDWCGGRSVQGVQITLRYAPLSAQYELLGIEGAPRRFAQRANLLAALDRVRLPLASAPPQDCALQAEVALQLTSLPTPLRFPALLQPGEWRMVSPRAQWPAAPR